MDFTFDTKNTNAADCYKSEIVIPVKSSVNVDGKWIQDVTVRIVSYNNHRSKNIEPQCFFDTKGFGENLAGRLFIPKDVEVNQSFLNKQKELLNDLTRDANAELNSRIVAKQIAAKKADSVRNLQG